MSNSYTRRLHIYINGKEVKNEIASIRAEMQKLSGQQARMTIGSKEYVAAGTEIKKLKGILKEHGDSLKVVDSSASKLAQSFKSFLPALGVAAVVGFFSNLGRQIFSVQEKFQTFAAVLKTALGSNGAAASSLQMIQDFAAKTPFSVEGLTGSFIKLVNRGFKPTKEELTKMGDLASSTGKDFDMLVEAILDAETSEFERLKEFGIKAKVSGDQVTLTFKGVKTTIDNNAESIRAYILGLGELNGVMGSMAAISETLSGKTSNLGDAWTGFIKALGDGTGGIFSSVISGLTGIVNTATMAVKGLRQIKQEGEISHASENVQESLKEIEIMTSSLVKNGVEREKARKQAYDLYKAEMNKQLNSLTIEIDKLSKEVETSRQGKRYVAQKKKEDLESRRRMLADEMDQIKALKEAEVDYSITVVDYAKLSTQELNKLIKKGDQLAKAELKSRKAAGEGIKDAIKEIDKQITDLDTKINNAISAGDLPLAQKFMAEMQALIMLRNTHLEVKKQIEKGWRFPAKEMGPVEMEIWNGVDKLSSKGYNQVKPDNKNKTKSPLQKRETGLDEATSEDAAKAVQDKVHSDEAAAQELRDYYRNLAFDSAELLNDNIFSLVTKRQQAEFDHALDLLQKQRNAELANKNLTESQKDAINRKYDAKERALKQSAWKKQHNADLAQAWVNLFLSVGKAAVNTWPVPAIPMMAAAAVSGGMQVAGIQAQKMPEFSDGGFTMQHSNNRAVAGVVHANEYVIPAEGVNNPSLRPMINMIELARQNKSLSVLNPSLFKISAMGGFAGGGYTSYLKDQIDHRFKGAKKDKEQDALLIKLSGSVDMLTDVLSGIKSEGIEAKVAIRGRYGINEKLAEDKETRKNAYL